jgi:hypothetical protein
MRNLTVKVCFEVTPLSTGTANSTDPQDVGLQGAAPGPRVVGPQGVSPLGVGPQGVSPQGVSPLGVGPQASRAHTGAAETEYVRL